ncbi:uncharacterized protein LOC128964752 [Oppia nitens]|uniref:uncharacterized protein LOC128964752 n=1 Tax=Oppia nitens TaxID=1686743 RepID=UPI0023DC32E3|nr:uncharacterized protein LOC128964752 [Oppia nitens]
MSRHFNNYQLLIFCFLLLTIFYVQCKDKHEVKARDSSASDNLIVSVINGVIKLKDSDFFRSNIEASVRSVFSKPLTSAVYAVSVLAGVVAMLAFYESPVSPMPVPPLPDPPVGRFPPEHPIWPPPHREPIASDKKRIGAVPQYSMPNPNPHISSNVMFPQTNQKYSDMDNGGNAGAYQQMVNMLENRNSKVNVKQNRISSNPVAEISPQVYSSFAVETDPKVLNDTIKLQNLYADITSDDRYDSADIINKFYNQNTFDKIKEFTGMKKVSTSETFKDKEKMNYTLVATSDSNASKRTKN